MTTTITRACPGLYYVSDGDNCVTVTQFTTREGATFNGWVAAADWSRSLLTDPLPTYREARSQALLMLVERERELKSRGAR